MGCLHKGGEELIKVDFLWKYQVMMGKRCFGKLYRIMLLRIQMRMMRLEYEGLILPFK